jgi:hypothetical protein
MSGMACVAVGEPVRISWREKKPQTCTETLGSRPGNSKKSLNGQFYHCFDCSAERRAERLCKITSREVSWWPEIQSREQN